MAAVKFNSSTSKEKNMRPLHFCRCGQEFELKVLLAIHCGHLGHKPAGEPPPPPVSRPAFLASRRSVRIVVAGLLLLSVLTINVATATATSRYTAWKHTSNVLVMP